MLEIEFFRDDDLAPRVSEVVDLLRKHFSTMKVVTVQSNIAFEASPADTTPLKAAPGRDSEHTLESEIPLIIEHERVKRARQGTAVATRPPRVLVTSASRKIPLVRALQQAARAIHSEARVVAGDMDPNALSFHVADESWTMPSLADSEVDELLAQCLRLGITAVLPTRDGELMFWARHAAKFRQAGVEVLVSGPEALQRCLDKLAFSEFGVCHGLPLIPAALSASDLCTERFVVKERFGAGSRAIGMNLDRTQAISHAATLQAPIFQPFVGGQEISVDAWLDRGGRVKGLVLRRRDLVVNGESQITTTFRDAALEEQAAAILGRLALRGPVVMQAIIDAVGSLQVIECNARFGGASTASIAAGLDGLRWSLLEAAGAPIDDYPFLRAAGEVRQVRVPADIYVHGPDL